MKISYSWLKERLALELSASDLATHLLHLGFEVASIERAGPGFKGVVTAEILEIGKHPNADRLSLCTVSDGKSTFSVVCGAKNIAVGQKVPLARLGARLPGGREIGPAKIRGVDSQGMICSASELALGGGHEGILVLDPQTPLGEDFSQKAGAGDEVLDVEVTPNRPDCLSHLGLARELSAYFRLPLKEGSVPGLPAAQGESLPVALEAGSACPRYLGRVITGVKVGPSPGWLAARLEAVGLRPINNVVDVTNFILMDMGQPLHAFDLAKLAGGRIAVRFAKAGERLKALDGKDYPLTPETLVIADAERPVAVAGVMGGEESAVSAKTTALFLEAAYFAPPAVRRTSQLLRLRSDSSYRFERGTDPAALEAASERAVAMILSLCPGAKVSAPKEASKPIEPRSPIVVSTERINKILGSEFPADAVTAVLERVGRVTSEGSSLLFTVPSWRHDLESPWDLAEEVGRLLSYQNIPAKLSPVPPKPARTSSIQALSTRARRRLVALGLTEAYNYDFVSEKALTASRIAPGAAPRLANPVSDDQAVLRPSLLPGLLKNAWTNLNHGASAVRLFELGKTYAAGEGGIVERWRAAGVLLGPTAETFWKPGRAVPSDFFDAKGVVADLLSGVPGLSWEPFAPGPAAPGDAPFSPAASLRLALPKGPLGAVGLLHPAAARAWELERENAAVFELDLELLAELEPGKARFAPFSTFPSARRDLSLLVPESCPWSAVAQAVAACGLAELARLELVDEFRGKGVPAGKTSLTVRLHFSAADRTLKDAEVAAAVETVLAALKRAVGAALRS